MTDRPGGDLRMAAPAGRGRPVTIVVDGRRVPAHEGESVAAALWAARIRTARLSEKRGEPRGYFCGAGVCHECLMTVDGRPGVQTCLAPVRDGLSIQTPRGPREETRPS